MLVKKISLSEYDQMGHRNFFPNIKKKDSKRNRNKALTCPTLAFYANQTNTDIKTN